MSSEEFKSISELKRLLSANCKIEKSVEERRREKKKKMMMVSS
jgi:hypothetical protein